MKMNLKQNSDLKLLYIVVLLWTILVYSTITKICDHSFPPEENWSCSINNFKNFMLFSVLECILMS